MEIADNKLITKTVSEILSEIKKFFQEEYGENFQVKDGGILGNILEIVKDREGSIQDNLEYFSKQFNPETAQNIWQDALYERIGVFRLAQTYTRFSKEISGTPNSVIEKSSILIRNALDGNEFTNADDIKINGTGKAVAEFIAQKAGEINVVENDTFKIVRAPVTFTDFTNSLIKNIRIGRDKESDDKYRVRFRNSKAINSKATARANLSNLIQYVDDISYISILDKNDDVNRDADTIEITVKHNTSDTDFAKAILETFGCGIKFIGTSTVNLKDIKGNSVQVKFNNASEVPINIFIGITTLEEQNCEDVISQIKETVLNYINGRVFGLGSVVYATELIVPIVKNLKDIVAVNELKIKRAADEEYFDIITLNDDEIPIFPQNQIFITEETENEIS